MGSETRPSSDFANAKIRIPRSGRCSLDNGESSPARTLPLLCLRCFWSLNEPAGQLTVMPLHGESVRYDVPLARWRAGTVVGAHARAFALNACGIPASGRTLLLGCVGLDDVDPGESRQKSTSHIFKPGFWRFPAPELIVPFWLAPVVASQPGTVIGSIGQADHERLAPAPAIDHRYLGLPPNGRGLLIGFSHRSGHSANSGSA